MVGVAGKSQGCATCRRRKIKCDERKPSCAKCEQGRRDCEGYDRFPVFIDRTQKGFRKRRPLEETKPSAPDGIATLPSPDAEATLLISWFWESFAHSRPQPNASSSPSHWLDHFLAGYSSSPPLKHALLAVSTTKLSRSTGRTDVLMAGRRLYIQSLTLTRRALMAPKTAHQDEILATTCVMILYELLDATNNGIGGWLNHLAGISRLIQDRGPQNLANPAARSIFEHGRYLLMLQHLLARKGSVFSQPAWIEEPWLGVKKNLEQQVFDEGLKLASLFERCDAAAKHALKLEDTIELFEECNAVYDRLQNLYEEHIAPAVTLDFDCVLFSAEPFRPVVNPTACLLSITALGIQLGACASANDVLSRIIKPSLTALDFCSLDSSSVRNIADRKDYLLSNRQRLAEKILNYINFCLSKRMGSMGAARMIFSLRLATQQFQPTDPEFEQSQALLERLGNQASRIDFSLRSSPSITASIVLYDKANLAQENASSIVQQWLRFADNIGSEENSAESLPVDVEKGISGRDEFLREEGPT